MSTTSTPYTAYYTVGDKVQDKLGGNKHMIVVSVTEIPAEDFFLPELDKTVAEYNEEMFHYTARGDPVIGVSFESDLDTLVPEWHVMDASDVADTVIERNDEMINTLIYSYPQSRLEPV